MSWKLTQVKQKLTWLTFVRFEDDNPLEPVPSNISKHLLLLGRILVSKWGLRPNIRVQAFAPHIYHLKKLFCQLYNIILQYIQHPNFYFPILLIKIIFLHNKIIYPKIIIIYNTTHYLFFLSHSFYSRRTTNLPKPPSPQAHHCCTTHI